MHIVQAHKFYWYRDGASNYALFLSKLLEGNGHTIIPFSMHHPKALPSRYDKYFVSHMDLEDPEAVSIWQKLRYAGRMFYSLEAKKHMRTLLAEQSVDVVHLHNIYHHISPSILGEIKKQGIPIVMTLHDYKLIAPNYTMFHHGAVHEEDATGWYSTCVKHKCMKDSYAQSALVQAEMIFHHKIMKYYERYVDRFIAPSQFILDMCVTHGWPKEKFTHIPHPIDSMAYAVSNKPGDYVAYVGRLSEEKGLQTLVDAAIQTPHIPYKIVGDGHLMPVLKERIEKENIPNITLTGFQTGKALHTLLNEARVLVVPSIWYENYPLSILEPKALGKVVLGSDIGGIKEMLPKELLSQAGDASSLAKSITLWYGATSAKRKNMGATLRKEIELGNDPGVHIAAIEAVYQEVINASR